MSSTLSVFFQSTYRSAKTVCLIYQCLPFFIFQGATSSNYSVKFHDVSRLETIHVDRIVQIHTTNDILKSINHARGNRLKVSIAGARHSEGGQAYVTGGIVLDMKSYRKVLRIDPSARVITIQSGGTWADVQAAVNHFRTEFVFD
jgi:FAD/FMN-containing dehydrogenase